MSDQPKPNGQLIMPTKEQLQDNIKRSEAWMGAIRRCRVLGDDCEQIAIVLDFLRNFHDMALKQYESMTPQPEFGKPQEPATAPGGNA